MRNDRGWMDMPIGSATDFVVGEEAGLAVLCVLMTQKWISKTK